MLCLYTKPGTHGYSRVLILNLPIVFSNSIPKISFLGKFGQENSKCFALNETWYPEYSRLLIRNLIIGFLNSVPKIPFLGKFGPKTSKGFVLNETQFLDVFKGGDSEFDNCFLTFSPKNTFFLAKFGSKTSKGFF